MTIATPSDPTPGRKLMLAILVAGLLTIPLIAV